MSLLLGILPVPGLLAVAVACATGFISYMSGATLPRIAALGATVGLVAGFVTLTHYPFPEITPDLCLNGGVEPLLIPFHTLPSALEAHAETPVWQQRLVLAALANLGLCLMIGASATQLTPSLPRVVGLAALGSLTIEISQLTGVFGLYPCAVRQFDVDDLILNIGGVALGYGATRHWVQRRRQQREPRDVV